MLEKQTIVKTTKTELDISEAYKTFFQLPSLYSYNGIFRKFIIEFYFIRQLNTIE